MSTQTAPLTNEQFQTLLEQLKGQQQTQAPAAPIASFQAAPMIPAQAMQPMPAMGMMGTFGQAPAQQLAPKGIFVTVNLPLGNGVELPLLVEFGPEHFANLPAFAQAVYGMFGQALKTYTPRSNFGGGGFGGNNGGGWNNGGVGFRGGRRW